MAKIKELTIHAGHNPKGKIACGASDYLDESTEARKLVKLIIPMLKKEGIKAYDCTVNNGTSQSDVLKKIVTKCNTKNRDVDISIHFNAHVHDKKDGKTKGVEVVVINNNGLKGDLGRRICNQISKIGFTNRGVVEDSRGLYFLKHTTKPAILVEVCFVTDQDDAILYQKNRKKVAEAIVQAIKNYNVNH